MAKKVAARSSVAKKPGVFHWILLDLDGIIEDECGPCTQKEAVTRFVESGLICDRVYTLQKIVDVAHVEVPSACVPPPIVTPL